MVHQIDTSGTEADLIAREGAFDGADVLEIGCGDGRMTRLYAGRARSVRAIDPKESLIERAIETFPEELASKVRFEVGAFGSTNQMRGAFEVVFFSHSL
jgi:ubiquinone/menaquinone biosynthesis C-methylase UbiE